MTAFDRIFGAIQPEPASAREALIAAARQRILILAGTPFGAPGAANLLRLAHAPAKGRGKK